MPYAMFCAWIYLFHVVLVFGSISFHAFHVYGLIYMFYISLYAYLHACAQIYGSLCLLLCFMPCSHVQTHVFMPMCTCLYAQILVFTCLCLDSFFTCLDLHPYMLICLDLYVFMPYAMFSCLDLSFPCIVVQVYMLTCLISHFWLCLALIYMFTRMFLCLNVQIYVFTCLRAQVFFSICSMLFPMLDQYACMLLAMFMCLGLGFVCHAMCYCSSFVPFITFSCVLV